mgnify:CR=1 FL=1
MDRKGSEREVKGREGGEGKVKKEKESGRERKIRGNKGMRIRNEKKNI